MAHKSSEVKPAPISIQVSSSGRDEPDSRPSEHAWFGLRFARSRAAKLIVAGVFVLLLAALAAVGGIRAMDRARANEVQTLADNGRASYASGEFDAAIQDLQSAVELDPSDAGAHLLLAQAFEATGELTQAEAAYRASLEIDPRQPQALYNLAIIHESQGKIAEAVEELERAIQIDGAFVGARLTLAELYAARGDDEAARVQYEAVLEMEPLGTDLEAIRERLRELE